VEVKLQGSRKNVKLKKRNSGKIKEKGPGTNFKSPASF
jgi:hypothetical protein